MLSRVDGLLGEIENEEKLKHSGCQHVIVELYILTVLCQYY